MEGGKLKGVRLDDERCLYPVELRDLPNDSPRVRPFPLTLDDVEDVYPGDVAQDGLTRFKESRKVMEGELATG